MKVTVFKSMKGCTLNLWHNCKYLTGKFTIFKYLFTVASKILNTAEHRLMRKSKCNNNNVYSNFHLHPVVGEMDVP